MRPGPENASRFARLFQRGADRAKIPVERGANTLHRGDDRDCDPGRDQPVFDGGGAGFVLQKLQDKRFHLDSALI